MKLFRNLALAALAVLPASALAGAAFEINGLHVELVFTDAVARAEQLGGVCQSGLSRRRGGGVIAVCEYPSCLEENSPGVCDESSLESSGRMIASQPIIQIRLEAPEPSFRLTRIAMVFEGSPEVVAKSLKQKFGQPRKDPSATTEGSWTHSRRLHWKQDNYHMGLLDIVNTIMLTINPRSQNPDPGAN